MSFERPSTAPSQKIAYFDCPTGIAGDMCLGALVDAGVPIDYLCEHLDRLGIAEDYRLRTEPVLKNDQAALKVHVDLRDRQTGEFQIEGEGGQIEPLDRDRDQTHEHAHEHSHQHAHGYSHPHSHEPHHHETHAREPHHHGRTLPDIEASIEGANLPERARDWSLAVFRRLAQAESEVHGKPLEEVHFHEVGGIDAIVDIVGTCLGLDWLNVDAVYCSALPTGGGTVWAAHGRMPVPVPAVLKLWQMRGVPVYDNGIDRELVTPTGAALMVELAQDFGKPPAMAFDRVGWGAGTIDLKLPNALRLWVGPAKTLEAVEEQSLGTTETIAVLETQIDDLSPQAIGYTFDRLFEAGALDVFTTAIGMKKSRTGLALTVICHPDRRIACETVIFHETSTLGIRYRLQPRTVLAREFVTVAIDLENAIDSARTKPQTVALKLARDCQGAIVNVQPEYEDLARVARETGQTWQAVRQAALRAYDRRNAVG